MASNLVSSVVNLEGDKRLFSCRLRCRRSDKHAAMSDLRQRARASHAR